MKKRRLHLRFRFIVAEEYQPLQYIKKLHMLVIWVLIATFLTVQISISLRLPPPKSSAINMPEALSDLKLSALSLGDKVATSKVIMLWLQAFDNQQGQSLSFYQLDYKKVAAWLTRISHLDPKSQYPFFSAVSIYAGSIDNKDKVRTMLEFVESEFSTDPSNRWRWMATSATLAKEELEDIKYALKLAKELRARTTGFDHVPTWAKQMEVFLLNDLNDFDSSADLVLKLVQSGEIKDPHEFNLHIDRLIKLRQKMINEKQVTSKEQLQEMFKKIDEIQSAYIQNAEA